jgi:hypothetical protein
MNFDKFLKFDELITESVIKIIYLLGALVITLIGLFIVVAPSFILPMIMGKNAGYALYGIVFGVIVILFGNLFWRIACEAFIVIFKIHDSVVSIDNKLKKQE